MVLRSLASLLAVLLAFAAVPRAAAAQEPGAEPPAVLREALARAADERRLVIVQVPRGDDGAAAHMDATSWQDPSVRAFVERHVVLVRAAEPDVPALLERVHGRPATVLLPLETDGAVGFGEARGYLDAEALLTWLRRVRLLGGVGRAEHVPQEVQDAAERRYRAASRTLAKRRWAEATPELLWAWDELHWHAPSMAAVRRSFLVGELSRLAAKHEPARAALVARRDALTAVVETHAADADDVRDWAALHDVLGDLDALVAWFDAVRGRPDWAWEVDHTALELRDALVERGRFADLLAFAPDPLEEIRRDLANAREFEDLARVVRASSADLYTALLDAGRIDDAARAAQLLLDADPSSAALAALVRGGMRLGCARPEFAAWLLRAERDATDAMRRHIDKLRERLAELPPC